MTWPLVDSNDDGLRPAGKPDECFYCRQHIGQPHDAECVCVTKLVEMRVIATLPTGEVLKGTWRFREVHSWDEQSIEFHKNESSWCASNFLDTTDRGDTVTWDPGSEGAMDKLRDLDSQISSKEDGEAACLCGVINGNRIIRFEFVRVVDDTPHRELRSPEIEA